MDSEEFDWDTEGKDSSLGLDRLWALAEVASSLMQAATRGTSILEEVRNVEISRVTQQLLCSKSHDAI